MAKILRAFKSWAWRCPHCNQTHLCDSDDYTDDGFMVVSCSYCDEEAKIKIPERGEDV